MSCPQNVTVANQSTNKCDDCSTTCKTCVNSTTTCTSCNDPNVLYNSQCLTQCPPDLVNKSGVCSPCDSPCAACSLTSTNCTSCLSTSSTPHYLNNTCWGACPSTYYNESTTGNCLLCSTQPINCKLCSSAITCIACDPTYMLFPVNSSCLNFVPAGYVNISGVAYSCDGECATCSIVTTNCTSCKTKNLLGNACIDTCPSSYVPIGKLCVSCASPCYTCSSITTNCTSCVAQSPALYLSNNLCISSCPNYTYPNTSTLSCLPCVDPCLTCTTKSTCSSCVNGYFYYQQACLTTCPDGYVGIALVCQPCTSPCRTCTNSTSTCLSCLSGLSP